jgi:hypothetical protein
MPPYSAYEEELIGLLGSSQHSSAGTSQVVPKPLTEHDHDEQEPVLGSSQHSSDGTSQAVPEPLTEHDHDEQEPVLKKVSFSNQVLLIPTLHIGDYTQEEMEATWLSKTDFENIKADMKFAIDLINQGLLDEEDTVSHCYRGLECRTIGGSRKRMLNKITARDAVLDEQDRQYDSCVTDSEAIAKVYIVTSHPCQVSAHTMGMFDEKDARWRSLPRSILPQLI